MFADAPTSLVGEHVMVAVTAAEHLSCLMPVPGDFLLKIDSLGGSSLLLCPPKSMNFAHKQYSAAEKDAPCFTLSPSNRSWPLSSFHPVESFFAFFQAELV